MSDTCPTCNGTGWEESDITNAECRKEGYKVIAVCHLMASDRLLAAWMICRRVDLEPMKRRKA